MKHFTRGWHSGELTDEESRRVANAYQHRLAEITPKLPPALRELASISLHDAVIDHIIWTPHAKRLEIEFAALAGDQTYRTVGLRYEGALLGDQRIEALRNAARDRETEVLATEVDVDENGLFSHRLLFWPRDEVTIDFVELHLTVTPRDGPRVGPKPAFYQALPDDDPEPE